MTEVKWFERLLACPDCREVLSRVGSNIKCARCVYSTELGGQLSLLPSSPFPRALERCYERDVISDESFDGLEILPPARRYDGPMPGRDSSQLLSEIMAHELGPNPAVLDLGCGPKDQATCFEHLKYRYVGLDHSGSSADILADGHFLPFAADSFDVVFSYAVLEHLYDPFLALTEIGRVLKPRGIFVGTVSQGEPFHSSYFHHSPWALLSLARTTDFEVARLWPTRDTLAALSAMGRYPRVIREMIKLIDFIHRHVPILAPRRMNWSNRSKALDQLYRSGSIAFCLTNLKANK